MSETYTGITNKLPSGCICYPEVDKSNPESVKVRTLKGKDEKLISEISASNFDTKFLQVLKNVVVGVDCSKLTLGDRMYLALWLTINSYGKEFTVEYECDQCWKKSLYTVDLSSLDIVQLPKDFKEPYQVKLPKTGTTLNLRLLRAEDLLKVDELVKANQNVWLYRYALSIVNEKSVWDNLEMLDNMDVADIAIIRGFHDKFNHGPKMETKYKCPHCEVFGVMPVTFRLEMLLPYGEELQRHIGRAI
jgi:hypothetical protein